jgi:hypothetical protein
MTYCFSIDNFVSQNWYSIFVLSRNPTTNYLSYILIEIKHTIYCVFVTTSLVYSEILNVLYVITIHTKEYIYLETKF